MSLPSNVVSVMDPQIPCSQSIYEESTTQQAKLGTRIAVGERVFRYAKAGGGNITIGQVVCAPSQVATYNNATVAVDTAAAGKTTMTVTVGTNVAINAFAEGYVVISSSALAGCGVMLRIKSHASYGSGATNASLVLYDSIPVNTIAAGPVTLLANPYNGVQIGSLVLDTPVGVAPIAITAGNYGWIQTWGPCSPMHTAATPVAADITMGTLGTVIALRSGTEGGGATVKSIGKHANLVGTANWFQPVMLTIAP